MTAQTTSPRESTIPTTVTLSECFHDPAYARELKDPRIDKIMAEWDDQLSTELLVSLRDDGRYAIIDGNHHAEAARRLFGDDYEMRAHVYIDLVLTQEAELYTSLNVSQVKLDLLDQFKAKIVYNDTDATTLKALVESCEFTIAIDSRKGLRAISVLQRIYKQVGIPMLADTLLLMKEAWGTDSDNIRGEAIEGMIYFLARYRSSIRNKPQLDRLIGILREQGPAGMISQMGKMRAIEPNTKLAISWGRGLRALYNSGLRKRLDEWAESVYLTSAARIYEPLLWRAR